MKLAFSFFSALVSALGLGFTSGCMFNEPFDRAPYDNTSPPPFHSLPQPLQEHKQPPTIHNIKVLQASESDRMVVQPPLKTKTSNDVVTSIEKTAIPVPGKPGLVRSPYDESRGLVSVEGLAAGARVIDPYTGRIMIVPKPPSHMENVTAQSKSAPTNVPPDAASAGLGTPSTVIPALPNIENYQNP